MGELNSVCEFILLCTNLPEPPDNHSFKPARFHKADVKEFMHVL